MEKANNPTVNSRKLNNYSMIILLLLNKQNELSKTISINPTCTLILRVHIDKVRDNPIHNYVVLYRTVNLDCTHIYFG